eukprot:Gb_22271 [translate_table: standard]
MNMNQQRKRNQQQGGQERTKRLEEACHEALAFRDFSDLRNQRVQLSEESTRNPLPVNYEVIDKHFGIFGVGVVRYDAAPSGAASLFGHPTGVIIVGSNARKQAHGNAHKVAREMNKIEPGGVSIEQQQDHVAETVVDHLLTAKDINTEFLITLPPDRGKELAQKFLDIAQATHLIAKEQQTLVVVAKYQESNETQKEIKHVNQKVEGLNSKVALVRDLILRLETLLHLSQCWEGRFQAKDILVIKTSFDIDRIFETHSDKGTNWVGCKAGISGLLFSFICSKFTKSNDSGQRRDSFGTLGCTYALDVYIPTFATKVVRASANWNVKKARRKSSKVDIGVGDCATFGSHSGSSSQRKACL